MVIAVVPEAVGSAGGVSVSVFTLSWKVPVAWSSVTIMLPCACVAIESLDVLIVIVAPSAVLLFEVRTTVYREKVEGSKTRVCLSVSVLFHKLILDIKAIFSLVATPLSFPELAQHVRFNR